MKKAKTVKTTKKPDIEQEINSIILEIFKKLSITVEVEVSQKDEGNYKANIKTEETGLLIGYHGETINSLQLIVGVILYKKTGSWHRVVLDVGDYRQKREDSIKEMVDRIIVEVEESGGPVTLPQLTPLERRFVHVYLSENKKVASESIGEGKDRRLTVKPR